MHMEFIISNSCFTADSFPAMAEFPKEYGIEVQIEFGTEYYWKTCLKKVMDGRIGALTIHGPFTNVDLAADGIDENELLNYYQWSFDMYRRFGATQMVIHPDGKINAPVTEAERAQMRMRATGRIKKLAAMARDSGVTLLIENLRPKGYGLVFDQQAFIELFSQVPDVDCLIDTGHLLLSGWDFEQVLTSLADRIKAYHIDDTRGVLDEHLPVDFGVIDWKNFFSLYKKNTPAAALVLEYKGVTVDEILRNADRIREYLK